MEAQNKTHRAFGRSFQGKERASPVSTSTSQRHPVHPEATIEGIEQAYEQQVGADGDNESQAPQEGEQALASIERVSDNLQEKVEQFEERGDALREWFQEAMA
ncbi:hypothetical protein PM020_17600 [Halorubrum ezzemoulense]|nr:hypothetical protein [Halorubrum ezzemoulense]MDB2243102.1 hypothetical protein [Halorubrum ezzemoulense]